MKSTFYFKTNTLLKDLVGKDLINDDDIAIVELVKNAYDAGSKSVLVAFSDLDLHDADTTKNSKIIIADSGSGMDLEDIEDKWLNIAYSEKKAATQEVGAFLAGNKGVGRFSCDRLGECLDVLTRKNNGSLLHLRINWLDFEVEGKKDLTIQQVPVRVSEVDEQQALKITGLEEFPSHGTALVISHLRGDWDRGRLLQLKRSLEKFLNPNQLFLKDKFEINLSVPDLKWQDQGEPYHNQVNGTVENQVFDKLKFNTTYIDSTISSDQIITTELYHEGQKVFKIVERNKNFQHLTNAKVVVYYLNPYKKAYFKRQTGFRAIDFGSVFLFLNGFRVAPYGDQGNDWLGLDVRKSQGVNRFLGSRDIVGRIEIMGEEVDFKPVSSREGLKRTDALIQLKEGYFFSVIRQLERFVVDGLDWDSVPEPIRREIALKEGLNWEDTSERYIESWERKQQRIVLSMMTLIGSSPDKIISFWFNPSLLEDIYESRTEDVKKLIDSLDGYDSRKVDSSLKASLLHIKDLITKKEEEVLKAKAEAAELRVEQAELKADQAEKKEAIAKLEVEKEAYRSQTLFLQSTAPLDKNLLMSFHHQINNDSTTVGNYIGKVMKALRPLGISKNIIKDLESASRVNLRIGAVAQYATKAKFKSSTVKQITDIPGYIQQYLSTVAPDFVASSLKLQVNNNIDEAFEIKVSRIELSILIDNILSNADKAGANSVEVDIAKISENSISIIFTDDGKGLSKEVHDIDSIFEIGVTTTPGSGLGLYHCKQIVEAMGGKIHAEGIKPKGFRIIVEITR